MKPKLKQKLKRLLTVMMSLLMLIGMYAPGVTPFAEGKSKAVDVKITKFEIQNNDHTTATKVYHTDTFLLMMQWDATHLGINLHKDDFFDVNLPDNMRFPSDTTARDFDLKDTDGTVVAKAHVTPGPNDEGGKIHVVFTDKVNNKYNVKGTMYLAAKFAKGKIKYDEKNTFSITVNSEVSGIDDEVLIQGPTIAKDEYLCKWGGSVKDKPNQARWHVRINHLKADMHNVVITDTMGDSGEIFIPGSFKLKKVTLDKYGNILPGEQNIEIGDKLKLGEGNKSFELKLGDIGTQQLYLEYDTTYTPGKTLKNSATLNSAEKTKNVSFSYRSAESGGTGSGDLASKIMLIKVDKENKQIKLANAVFTVTKPDGSTFELTTGADGTVASGVLEQGSYKVKEKTPPLGYLSSNEEYTLNVTPAGGAIQEIENKPIKIDVEGIKTWSDGDDQDGKRPVKITVNLLKNGAPFKTQEVREDADGNWKYSFKNLRKYENGQEIKYTVTENAVAGYSTEINGYDITNKYTPEKTSVTVTKSWNDSNDKDKIRPNSIKVQLYANGKKKGEVVELKKADHWTHTWRELPQKEKGKDIEYTVKEVGHISGYKVSVDDKDHGNIIITNTHTPKEEVSGPETGDGSNMKLYAGMLALSGMLLILVATKGSKLRNQK